MSGTQWAGFLEALKEGGDASLLMPYLDSLQDRGLPPPMLWRDGRKLTIGITLVTRGGRQREDRPSPQVGEYWYQPTRLNPVLILSVTPERVQYERDRWGTIRRHTTSTHSMRKNWRRVTSESHCAHRRCWLAGGGNCRCGGTP